MNEKILFTILCAALLTSCDRYDMLGMVACSSVDTDTRFVQSTEYNEAHPKAPYSATSDEYTFYLITDIHVNKKTTFTEAFVQKCLNDESAESFTVCLGDMVECEGNQQLAYEALKPLTLNDRLLYCIPGNHDLYFGDWDNYFACWGSSHYCITVTTPTGATDLYIFLDSANGTIGNKQHTWLCEILEEASRQGHRHIIIMTHVNFFDDDLSQGHSSTYQFEELYDLMGLFSKYNVKCVITGHDHTYGRTEFRNVIYYTLDCFTEMEESGAYYSVTVGDDITLNRIER